MTTSFIYIIYTCLKLHFVYINYETTSSCKVTQKTNVYVAVVTEIYTVCLYDMEEFYQMTQRPNRAICRLNMETCTHGSTATIQHLHSVLMSNTRPIR